MDNILEQWILPVFYEKDEQGERDTIGGQCFVIGSLLITAAHVIENSYKPYVNIGDEKRYLTKENALVCKYNKREDEDYIVFHFYGEKSPLQFATIKKTSQGLICRYYRKQEKQVVLLQSFAKISPISTEKAFVCEVNPMLYEGDSGCPIINANNEVIGMLVGSTEDRACSHICAFQNAAYIKKIIEQCLEN